MIITIDTEKPSDIRRMADIIDKFNVEDPTQKLAINTDNMLEHKNEEPSIPLVKPTKSKVKDERKNAVTADEIREAIKAYSKVNNMEATQALLQKYGANRLSELSVDKYDALMAECVV